MRLYFAGNTSCEEESIYCRDVSVQWRLLSFFFIVYDIHQNDYDYWISDAAAPGPFFLDSGAYSAMTRGVTIDFSRYCDFIKQHLDKIDPYASLDVIGDWRGSARYYDMMLAQGLKPIPTFHVGSPIEELRRLLKMADYVALGGMVGKDKTTVRLWLDKCWNVIKDYWPKKIHSFGNMTTSTITRYPWYSADSTSSIIGGSMGRIHNLRNGELNSCSYIDYSRKFMDTTPLNHLSTYSKLASGSAFTGRRMVNMRTQQALERYVTDLWQYKGITWES